MEDDHADDAAGAGSRHVGSLGRIVLGVLVAAAIISGALGFFPAFRREDPHFAAEGFGAFFAVYGFLAFMFIVLVGQHLRKLVGRKETYYDERE